MQKILKFAKALYIHRHSNVLPVLEWYVSNLMHDSTFSCCILFAFPIIVLILLGIRKGIQPVEKTAAAIQRSSPLLTKTISKTITKLVKQKLNVCVFIQISCLHIAKYIISSHNEVTVVMWYNIYNTRLFRRELMAQTVKQCLNWSTVSRVNETIDDVAEFLWDTLYTHISVCM